MTGIGIIQDLDRVNDPVRHRLGELQATAQTIVTLFSGLSSFILCFNLLLR
jgi:hypothetical protein